MKHSRPRTNLFPVIVLLVMFPFVASSQKEEVYKDKGIIVNVDLERSSLLRGNNLGFQLEGFIPLIVANDTAHLMLFKELSPRIVRFPSGVYSNYLNYLENQWVLHSSFYSRPIITGEDSDRTVGGITFLKVL